MLIAALTRFYGNDCKKSEGRAEAEVFKPQAQPLQAVRAAAGLLAQVRNLPFVLPGARAEGRDSRGQQVELVGEQFKVRGSQFTDRQTESSDELRTVK
jgi:hypothetical protein